MAREQSPLQKVCMQYGKDCFALSNTWTLARFLRENGQVELANNVEIAINRARLIAKQNYFNNRKALQPDWKDWDAQRDWSLEDIDWLGLSE
jgi:hypothetical protein